MRDIVHWTDLHIGAGKDKAHTLDAMVHYAQAMWHTDDVLISITGDLTEGTLNPFTQRAHWKQMDRARTLLMPLVSAGYQLLVSPGNHDHAPRGATVVTRKHRREFRKRVLVPLMPWCAQPSHPEFNDGEIYAISLDSTEGQIGPGVDWARGAFGYHERERLRSGLAGNHGVFRLAQWHHNTEYDVWSNRLEDEPQVLAILKQQGCELVLQGHEHVERWRFDMPGVATMLASGQSTASGAFWALQSGAWVEHAPFVG